MRRTRRSNGSGRWSLISMWRCWEASGGDDASHERWAGDRFDQIFDLPEGVPVKEWVKDLEEREKIPYWNNDFNQLFVTGSNIRRVPGLWPGDCPLQRSAHGLCVCPHSGVRVFPVRRGPQVSEGDPGSVLRGWPDSCGDREKVPEEDMQRIYSQWLQDGGRKAGTAAIT